MLGDAPNESGVLKHVCHGNVEVLLPQAVVCLVQDKLTRDIARNGAQSRSQINSAPGKLRYSVTELFDVAVKDFLASSDLCL